LNETTALPLVIASFFTTTEVISFNHNKGHYVDIGHDALGAALTYNHDDDNNDEETVNANLNRGPVLSLFHGALLSKITTAMRRSMKNHSFQAKDTTMMMKMTMKL
jgi:hypothetical protein